jgi:UDP-N-acetylglucosamine enolpyruvyl transferase
MNTAAVLRFHLMLVLVALVAAGCGTSVKRVAILTRGLYPRR